MEKKKTKTDLIFDSLNKGKENSDLSNHAPKKLTFTNLNVESIRPKKLSIEHSSVKIKTDLYEQIKEAAEKQGITQPGKFISLILEAYLQQADDEE